MKISRVATAPSGILTCIQWWFIELTVLGLLFTELLSFGWERILNRKARRSTRPVRLENLSHAWTRRNLAVDSVADVYGYSIDPISTPPRPDPKVSVIMPVYNGAGLISFSIESMLAQTFEDFELIIVDDGSTDHTVNVLKSYRDPRLRIIPLPVNTGVVGARNTALKAARGVYIAMLDHDDLSSPTRLAKQVEHLDNNPDTVMVATAGRIFQGGLLREFNFPKRMTPTLIKWMLHILNPFSFSTVMLRRSALLTLSSFTDQDFECAEDFHLYHQVLKVGNIARIDEPLGIYRLHTSNMTSNRERFVISQAAKVLADANVKRLGDGAWRAAHLFSRHVMAMQPVADAATLYETGRYLEILMESFMVSSPMDAASREEIRAHACQIWWRTVRGSVRSGRPWLIGCYNSIPALCAVGRPGLQERIGSVLRGSMMTVGSILKGPRKFLKPTHPHAHPAPQADVTLFGATYQQHPVATNRPPTLYVVIDTEPGPAGEDSTGLKAHLPVQGFFDGYGLRPIYLLDELVASQRDGYRPLLPLVERHSCAIGICIRPSTGRTFEAVDLGGEVPSILRKTQAAKIGALVATVEHNLGVRPLFHKNTDGLNAGSLESMADNGIAVDFSIVPGAKGHPSGRADPAHFASCAYQVGGNGPLFLPVTRGFVGRLSGYGPKLDRLLSCRLLSELRVRKLLGTLGLFEAASLAPEQFGADQQIAAIRAMIAQGQRVFVLHYRSRSVLPGDSSSVRTGENVSNVADRIKRVCEFFFDELGGLPGYPLDLVPKSQRPSALHSETARPEAPVPLISNFQPA